MLLQDRIILVKRARPIQARLPNSRTFISRYKRSTRGAIPLNIKLNRPYKQRPALKNKYRRRAAVQQQGRGLGSILKFAKRIVKNLLLKKLGRAALNKLANLYSNRTSKLKNKKLNRILQSDVANSLVDKGAKYSQQKLG